MIDPDDFDDEKNRSGVWTIPQSPTSHAGSPGTARSVGVSSPTSSGGSKALIWWICAIVVIGLIALGINERQRRQEEMRIQQENALREQQRRIEEAAESERKRIEAAAAAKRLEAEKRQQAERERREVALAVSNANAFFAAEQVASARVSTVNVSVRNLCQAGEVFIAFLYQSTSGDWVTAGWWKVEREAVTTPSVWPTNRNIYYFAEGSGFIWQGNEGAPARTVVGHAFAFKDDGAIIGRAKRQVRFRQSTGESPGQIELTCKVSQ